MSTDRELVDAVLAGRRGAFACLVRAHEKLVWHIVYRLVRDAEDARELSQETFLRVYRQLHQFRYASTLRTWIGRVAWSIALRHLERNHARLEATADGGEAEPDRHRESGADLEQAHATADMAANLHAAVDALPPLPRLLVGLYHLEEISIAEISEITGLPTGTIKSHLFRSRQQLRRVLERHLGVVS